MINFTYGAVNHWKQLLTVMAHYQDLFHAVVAVLAAAHRTVVAEPLSSRTHIIAPEILCHRGMAIQKLRMRLSRPEAQADDGALLTMLFLSVSPRFSIFLTHSLREDRGPLLAILTIEIFSSASLQRLTFLHG